MVGTPRYSSTAVEFPKIRLDPFLFTEYVSDSQCIARFSL